MKKILLAALAAFTLFGATTASAQGWKAKTVSLQFIRSGTGSDNPNAPNSYIIGTSNGNHNSANAGVAVQPEDTTLAIDIRDHYLRGAGAMQAYTSMVGDSTWLGTLFLSANSGTIDTVTYFLDQSVDGFNWTVRDSLQGHIVSDRSALTLGAVSDSARVLLASALPPASGAAGMKAGMAFTVIPAMGTAGVTAQSFQGCFFLRVRIHMTAGDFAAAGANNGIVANFTYPASVAQIPQ